MNDEKSKKSNSVSLIRTSINVIGHLPLFGLLSFGFHSNVFDATSYGGREQCLAIFTLLNLIVSEMGGRLPYKASFVV